MSSKRPLLIAGPTASGKSALALKAAKAAGGIIINADASQIYAGWRALTARPSAAEEAEVPHRLYGHVDPSVRFSVGDWLRDVAALMEKATERLIFVGGTGLYFKALTEGLVEIPPAPAELRADVAARLADLGREGLAAELSARDPATAAQIDLHNHMRVARALEVLDATGRGLADWHADTPPPLIRDAERWLIAPDRGALYQRCDARFDQMIADGALEEARAMLARGLDPMLPAMKAVGAPEFFAHLRGEITLEAAAEQAKQATRNYAKRQMTWMRNQMKDWTQVG
ncbi:MAG: tRNA (adenosine(37)-N6)-dimethylallyltransferase MiaA [Pseudomonadota bacterium]